MLRTPSFKSGFLFLLLLCSSTVFADWKEGRATDFSFEFKNDMATESISRIQLKGIPANAESGIQSSGLEVYFYARGHGEDAGRAVRELQHLLMENNTISRFVYNNSGALVGIKVGIDLRSSYGIDEILELFHEEYSTIEPYTIYTKMNDAIETLGTNIALASNKYGGTRIHTHDLNRRGFSSHDYSDAAEEARLINTLFEQERERVITETQAEKEFTANMYAFVPNREALPPEAGERCTICQNSFDDIFAGQQPGHSTLVRVQCQHVFCLDCISRAYKEKTTCPNCRSEL